MRAWGAATAVTAVICLGLAACGSGGGSPGPVAAHSTEVSFVVDGTTTFGTLDVPAHRADQHLAAALLLAGSGPNDRDGNQPPTVLPNTLRQIADALAGMGIMSLRFDKYFAGRTGAGRFAADPGSADLDAFIHQADAAYRYLAGQPAADPQRLLVVGHSEGGMYAILLAGTASPAPAGLALVEPQDERILDLVALQINEQLDTQVAKGAISADTARRNARGVRTAIDEFRAGQPVDTGGLLPFVANLLNPLVTSPATVRYTRTDDAIDVPAHAARLRAGTRVLVTDSTADTNIPLSTIQPLMDGLARAGTAGPGLVTLHGLSHFLVPAGTPVNGASLDPSFLAALRDWAQPYASA